MPAVSAQIKGHVNEFLSNVQDPEINALVITNLGDLEGIYVTKIPAKYAEKDTVGLCLVGLLIPQRVVFLDPEFIGAYPGLVRTLVFHELGHCLLDLGHSADPTDIMYTNLPSIEEWDWQQRVDQIFERARN